MILLFIGSNNMHHKLNLYKKYCLIYKMCGSKTIYHLSRNLTDFNGIIV